MLTAYYVPLVETSDAVTAKTVVVYHAAGYTASP